MCEDIFEKDEVFEQASIIPSADESDAVPEIEEKADDLDLDLSDLIGDDVTAFQSVNEYTDDSLDEFITAETSGFASGFPEWDLLPPER